jgi:hypothetical protein
MTEREVEMPDDPLRGGESAGAVVLAAVDRARELGAYPALIVPRPVTDWVTCGGLPP